MPRYRVGDAGNTEAVPDEDVRPEEDTASETEPETEPETEGDEQTADLDEDKIQKIIDRKFAQWNKKQERQLRKTFGTTNLDEARAYYDAGKAVTDSAGTSPNEVVSRLQARRQQPSNPQRKTPTFGTQRPGQERTYGQQPQQSGNPQAPNDAVLSEIREMRELIQGREVAEVREKESTEAKQEFGHLYEEHEMDIEDYAEDHGLSLTDAAAVVLRPHLAEYYETRARKRREKSRSRKVESSEGVSSGDDDEGVNYQAALSPELRRIAEKTGVGYKKMYEKRKEAGKPLE